MGAINHIFSKIIESDWILQYMYFNYKADEIGGYEDSKRYKCCKYLRDLMGILEDQENH